MVALSDNKCRLRQGICSELPNVDTLTTESANTALRCVVGLQFGLQLDSSAHQTCQAAYQTQTFGSS
jgi:hypothetical protein